MITAADKVGLDFILCRSETAAAISAAVTAELGGAPGVVLAGIGPGAASLVNGVAYAGLERAPLIVLTDARPTAPRQGPGNFLHQVFDQQAMFAPLAKAKIPLLHVVGDADVAVPVSENTAILEARYKKLGGKIQVIHKPGIGHHPHSLKDPKPIVDFILKHSGQ